MAQHKIAFFKGNRSCLDPLIRFATCGTYSHVELLHPTHPRLCISASGIDGGVRKKEIKTDIKEDWDVVELGPWMTVDSPWEACEAHLGAKYDFMGVLLSQFFSLNRHSPDKWFCSELIAHSIGLPRPSEYSPSLLYDTVMFMNSLEG